MRQGNRQRTHTGVWRLTVLCLCGGLVLNAGCYHYRVAGHNVAVANTPPRQTLWSTVWGLRQQNIDTDATCVGNPIAEVTTSTNVGYVLLTMLSLGFVAPVQVEWKCAKDRTPGGGGNVGDDF